MASTSTYHLLDGAQFDTAQRRCPDDNRNDIRFTRVLLPCQCLSDRRIALLDWRFRQCWECLLGQPHGFFHRLEWADLFTRSGESSERRHEHDDRIASREFCWAVTDWCCGHFRGDRATLHGYLYR